MRALAVEAAIERVETANRGEPLERYTGVFFRSARDNLILNAANIGELQQVENAVRDGVIDDPPSFVGDVVRDAIEILGCDEGSEEFDQVRSLESCLMSELGFVS